MVSKARAHLVEGRPGAAQPALTPVLSAVRKDRPRAAPGRGRTSRPLARGPSRAVSPSPPRYPAPPTRQRTGGRWVDSGTWAWTRRCPADACLSDLPGPAGPARPQGARPGVDRSLSQGVQNAAGAWKGLGDYMEVGEKRPRGFGRRALGHTASTGSPRSSVSAARHAAKSSGSNRSRSTAISLANSLPSSRPLPL